MERLDAAHALPAPSLANRSEELSPRAAVSALLEGEARLAKHLNEAQVAELRALGEENHEEIFWRDLLGFAGRLEAAEKLDAAAAVLATAVGAVREGPLQTFAQNRLDAIQGKGAIGGRAEFLLGRFTRDATDSKVILPMMAGSFVYGAVRAAALGRLAATTRGAWYAQGLAARLTASSLAFAAEVPTFALSARALRQAGGTAEGPSLKQELGSAALTLGFLKSFAFAGNQAFRGLHGIGENGFARRLASGTRASQFALSQGAMFTGLLAAHKTEEALGWRPQVDGATTITDTLAAMLSLSVGGHLGHKVLGQHFAAFQAEVRGRSELASRWTELAPGLRPLVATAQPAPGGMLLAMSLGSGRRAEPSGGDPSRIIRDLRIDLTSKDAKPKACRKAFGDLSKHLTMQLTGTRQSLGLGAIPFLAALGLGLETLLAPNTALAGPLEPLVSGDLNLLLLGATAAVSAALGFWAGWRARGRTGASSPTEIRNPAGSIYRIPTAQGSFNFLAELNPKRLQVTAFHENDQPREILFTKPQTIQGQRFSSGITAVVDAEGRLLRMRAAKNLEWHAAIFALDCKINDTTVPPEAEIYLTETGSLAYVQLPFGSTKVGAYNTAGPSQVHFHANGKIKALISHNVFSDDPLRGRYPNKYVFFDQNGKFLGAGEKLSDYDNHVKTPERLRIAAPPREKDRHPGDESPAAREAEAEREAEAAEARSDRRETSG
ncbi:hypothetical protein FBR05_02625 [Deltaproteobacteria bacterium PRO3]|nr:hypothetical protein [Deltaproteobacteria bacterium PRO3]